VQRGPIDERLREQSGDDRPFVAGNEVARRSVYMKRRRESDRLMRGRMAIVISIVMWPVLGSAAGTLTFSRVTTERLVNAQLDDGWLMYRRSYESTGYVPFDAINLNNVIKLKIAFRYGSGLPQAHEGAALVNGRYMYITTPMDHVIALDSLRGKVLWIYKHPIDKRSLQTVCCGVANRGVALFGDLVYLGTLDNHMIALNAQTGKVIWDVTLAPEGVGYSITGAPLVVNGRVLIGDGGGEYGARGFIVAMDAATGRIVWKTFTTALPSEPGGNTWPPGAAEKGGGNPWITGTYDRDSNTVYWGVGNASPWLSTLRPGENWYTDSVVALDADTGKIRWHYQWTPNDSWDYDGANETVMTDLQFEGRAYRALVHADRNGWFYAIDRATGKLIYAKPFVHTTSIVGMRNGFAVADPDHQPTMEKEVFTCPSMFGGKNWWPISLDPIAHLAFVPTMHTCMTIKGEGPDPYKKGLYYVSADFNVKRDPSMKEWGSLQAIDINSGNQVWEHRSRLPWTDGTLSTAGGLVFSGSADGYFIAFDSKTGQIMWRSPKLRSGIIGAPTSYEVDGKQYVAVWAGWGGAVSIWGGEMADDPAVKAIPRGGNLYVFALP
jgi:alcohol dehydrogenase (cytochrome c)